MSDFSKTSSLVHNESITVGENSSTKKRNPKKLMKSDTTAVEYLRHLNEDKIIDRYLEYTKEEEKDAVSDVKEPTFFDVDEFDSSSDSDSYDNESGD